MYVLVFDLSLLPGLIWSEDNTLYKQLHSVTRAVIEQMSSAGKRHPHDVEKSIRKVFNTGRGQKLWRQEMLQRWQRGSHRQTRMFYCGNEVVLLLTFLNYDEIPIQDLPLVDDCLEVLEEYVSQLGGSAVAASTCMLYPTPIFVQIGSSPQGPVLKHRPSRRQLETVVDTLRAFTDG
eukprot:Filipodium_phascolosomae@DN8782_c0_g1_i1.p1